MSNGRLAPTRVGVLGTGEVGRRLAAGFSSRGHDVMIGSREPGKPELGEWLSGDGAGIEAGAFSETAAHGDLLVLAVLGNAAEQAIADAGTERFAGKVVIDATNRMSFGADGPDIDTGSSNAEELAALLPEARVVKAFNTLFASHQADPIAQGVQLDGYVAADDDAARAVVLELVESIGLTPVAVGPLVRARQLEGLAFLNISLNIANGGSWQSGWKLVGAPVALADAA